MKAFINGFPQFNPISAPPVRTQSPIFRVNWFPAASVINICGLKHPVSIGVPETAPDGVMLRPFGRLP
jgi:hypothetical protein